MTSLSAQRCFNHRNREAVARCTGCGSFFCRECITEHSGRMICARCLLPQTEKKRRSPLVRWTGNLLLILTGLFLLWLLFFMLGRGLLAIPSSFHDGSAWENKGPEKR